MNYEFIQKLSKYITEDPDIFDEQTLNESDFERRKLERDYLQGDPYAKEAYFNHLSRFEPINLQTILDQYSQIIGFKPQDINKVRDNPDAFDSLQIMAERWTKHYLENRETNIKKLAEWLRDNDIESADKIASLIDTLWNSIEYLSEKYEWYVIHNGGMSPGEYVKENKEVYEEYARRQSYKTNRIIAKLKQLFNKRVEKLE